MGRIVSIDYGKKRTGLAATDILQMIANGLCTVPSGEVISFLKKYTENEPVDKFIIGLPKQMNNQPSENMKYIEPFKNLLKKSFPNIPIEMVDERFTSVLAHQAMIDGGLKKKDRQNKALVDEISAVIILQSYLETERYKR
ncbi:MAG: Holliday junction resolvase RuvX [Bacteroidales bacterium]